MDMKICRNIRRTVVHKTFNRVVGQIFLHAGSLGDTGHHPLDDGETGFCAFAFLWARVLGHETVTVTATVTATLDAFCVVSPPNVIDVDVDGLLCLDRHA